LNVVKNISNVVKNISNVVNNISNVVNNISNVVKKNIARPTSKTRSGILEHCCRRKNIVKSI
jgi:hypothetical protein